MPVLHMRMKVVVPKVDTLARKLGVDERGHIQQLVTDEVFKRMGKYMPRRSGALEDTKTFISKPTRIKTQGPYARYVFFGVGRGGKPLNYSKSKNPQAGPHWDRRMVKAEGRSIIVAVRRKIKRGS